jgi:hypothetical protein
VFYNTVFIIQWQNDINETFLLFALFWTFYIKVIFLSSPIKIYSLLKFQENFNNSLLQLWPLSIIIQLIRSHVLYSNREVTVSQNVMPWIRKFLMREFDRFYWQTTNVLWRPEHGYPFTASKLYTVAGEHSRHELDKFLRDSLVDFIGKLQHCRADLSAGSSWLLHSYGLSFGITAIRRYVSSGVRINRVWRKTKRSVQRIGP